MCKRLQIIYTTQKKPSGFNEWLLIYFFSAVAAGAGGVTGLFFLSLRGRSLPYEPIAILPFLLF